MNFKSRAIEHLSNYKRDALHTTKSGSFNGKKYSHILCNEEKTKSLSLLPSNTYEIKDNILTFTKIKHKPIKLHKNWYHLNSSQILCISYFYKFIEDAELLQKFCEYYDFGEPCGAEFEYMTEDGTNVDFVIHLKNGGHIFFEIKYTEQDFGRASLYRKGKSSDEVRKIYRARYEKFYSKVKISEQDYLNNYQVVRNISLAHKDTNNTVIFVIPHNNENLLNQLWSCRKIITNICDFRNIIGSWLELLDNSTKFADADVFKKYFDF